MRPGSPVVAREVEDRDARRGRVRAHALDAVALHHHERIPEHVTLPVPEGAEADGGGGGGAGTGHGEAGEEREDGRESAHEACSVGPPILEALMSTLTPEQATFILAATALPSLHAEHPVTKRVIAAIPADKVDFRPDHIVRSAIDLAWHIAAAETRFLDAVASGAFDFSGGARPESIRTPSDVVDWYSERFAKAVDRLKQMTGDQLTRIIDFRGLFQLPAVVLRPDRVESLHPPPRTALDVSPADGCEGAVDLR